MHPEETVLMDLALGATASADASSTLVHVASCARCLARFRQFEDTVGRLKTAAGTQGLIQRAWSRTAPLVEGPGRFDVFADELSGWLGAPQTEVESFLHALDDDNWSPGPAAGALVRQVPVGGARSSCMAVAIKLEHPAEIPDHEHFAPEHVFVLQGAYTSSLDGRDVLRGESVRYEPGTAHTVRALPGPPCICIVLSELPAD